MVARKGAPLNFASFLLVAFVILLSARLSGAQVTEQRSATNSVEAEATSVKTKPGATTATTATSPPAAPCKRTIKADVVAMAQPIMLNRLGAAIPGGMVFSLKQDTTTPAGGQIQL